MTTEAMTTDGGLAKIYVFPARGRFAIGSQRDESDRAADQALPPVAKVASGSAWYHEAAIEDAQRARES